MDRRERLSYRQMVDSPSDMSLRGWRQVIGMVWIVPSSATAFDKFDPTLPVDCSTVRKGQ